MGGNILSSSTWIRVSVSGMCRYSSQAWLICREFDPILGQGQAALSCWQTFIPLVWSHPKEDKRQSVRAYDAADVRGQYPSILKHVNRLM